MQDGESTVGSMGVVGAQHRWQHGRISVKVNESHYVLDVTRETTRPLRRTLLLQMSQRGLLGALFDNYLRYGLRSSRLILCEIPVPISGQLGLGSERSNPPPPPKGTLYAGIAATVINPPNTYFGVMGKKRRPGQVNYRPGTDQPPPATKSPNVAKAPPVLKKPPSIAKLKKRL